MVIKQPTEKRNLHPMAIAAEGKNIDILNEALGDIELTAWEQDSLVWLCGWETSTLKHIISAFEKAGANKQIKKTITDEEKKILRRLVVKEMDRASDRINESKIKNQVASHVMMTDYKQELKRLREKL